MHDQHVVFGQLEQPGIDLESLEVLPPLDWDKVGGETWIDVIDQVKKVGTKNFVRGMMSRDPAQPIDQAYTAQILKFTTDPSFNSPLTDYLPAGETPIGITLDLATHVQEAELDAQISERISARLSG